MGRNGILRVNLHCFYYTLIRIIDGDEGVENFTIFLYDTYRWVIKKEARCGMYIG